MSLSARPGYQAPSGCFSPFSPFPFFNASILTTRSGTPHPSPGFPCTHYRRRHATPPVTARRQQDLSSPIASGPGAVNEASRWGLAAQQRVRYVAEWGVGGDPTRKRGLQLRIYGESMGGVGDHDGPPSPSVACRLGAPAGAVSMGGLRKRLCPGIGFKLFAPRAYPGGGDPVFSGHAAFSLSAANMGGVGPFGSLS